MNTILAWWLKPISDEHNIYLMVWFLLSLVLTWTITSVPLLILMLILNASLLYKMIAIGYEH